MCKDCGCSRVESYAVDGVTTVVDPVAHEVDHILGDVHAHSHGHDQSHGHAHGHDHLHDHEHFHGDHHSRDHSHDHSHDQSGGHSHDHSHVDGQDHVHDHANGHPNDRLSGRSHDHPSHGNGAANGGGRRTLDLQLGLLSKNDRLAERNRGFFQAKGLLAINVFSSPGSGKTALLERTAVELAGRLPMGVVVGDLETDHDAARIRRAGMPAAQITTGSVCHLEAEMVSRAVARLPVDRLRVLFIENVGNLVCPAAYDLGEHLRVVLLSVTEGEDKPLKYPTAFKTAHVVIVSKTDIADAVGFDREAALENIRKVAPQAAVLELSARTGEGIDAWTAYLVNRAGRKAHHEIAQPGGAGVP